MARTATSFESEYGVWHLQPATYNSLTQTVSVVLKNAHRSVCLTIPLFAPLIWHAEGATTVCSVSVEGSTPEAFPLDELLGKNPVIQ